MKIVLSGDLRLFRLETLLVYKMILLIGEIFYYQYERVKKLGGNTFHVLYHLSSMGLPYFFISSIGNDSDGGKVLSSLRQCNINTQGVQVSFNTATPVVKLKEDDIFHGSGTLYNEGPLESFSLNNGKGEILDHSIKSVYISSPVYFSESGRELIHRVIENNKNGATVICDINANLKLDSSGVDIKDLLTHCDMVRIDANDPEHASELIKTDTLTTITIKRLIHDYSLRWLIVTNERGDIDLHTEQDFYHVKIMDDHDDKTPANTFGVGDAFLSMLLAADYNDVNDGTTVEMAREFSAEISKIKGAIPYNNRIYERFINQLETMKVGR